MTIKELREKRAQALADARKVSDLALRESRELTTDEQTAYNKAIEEYDRLHVQVTREETLISAEARHATAADPMAEQRTQSAAQTPEQRAAEIEFRDEDMPASWRRSMSPAELRERMPQALATNAYRLAMRNWMATGERRNLQADSDAAGGYITTPPQFVARLIQDVDDIAFVRQRATVIPIPGNDTLGVPTLDADPADADWTSELLTGDEDSTMVFGRRELKASPLAKRIKISNKLLRNGAIGAEGVVRARMAYKFGITQEKAHLTGTGANQPLGVFTASSNGISTGRDVSTGNSTTAPTVDGLKEAKYSLKAGWWRGASWIFHRSVVKVIAKLKDGEGRYLWEDSIVGGEPSTLLGFPVDMSEYAPSTMTTGLYVGILGDFSQYWIVDSMTMELQRLSELYAATNQTGIIGRLESDGMPVQETAFARVKLA